MTPAQYAKMIKANRPTDAGPCPIREHVPDVTGICMVCGEECYRPCPEEREYDDGTEGVTFLCTLFAGHEGNCDFGVDE